jgi:hypothetical protein
VVPVVVEESEIVVDDVLEDMVVLEVSDVVVKVEAVLTVFVDAVMLEVSDAVVTVVLEV